MKPKYKLNIDYLKLCYRQPEGLFEAIDNDTNNYIYGDGYNLLVIEKDDTRVLAKVLVPDENGPWSLGTVTLNKGGAFQGKAFFEFDNRALYEVFTYANRRPCNYIGCLEYITDDLGLEYNNLTKMDIALDTNVNVMARMKKRIRNHEELDMFLCRHRVRNADEKLDGYGEYYASTRKRLMRTPEIIISQARDDGTRLKVYDKTRELKESRPDKSARYHIWLGDDWSPEKDRIFRVEVSIRNEDQKDIWAKYADGASDMPFLQEIQDEDWLKRYFVEGLESLLYFRDKTTGERVAAF